MLKKNGFITSATSRQPSLELTGSRVTGRASCLNIVSFQFVYYNLSKYEYLHNRLEYGVGRSCLPTCIEARSFSLGVTSRRGGGNLRSDA